MILLAAAAFFATRTPVNELSQASQLLTPLLGNNATVVFAVALLFSGVASTTTSGMAFSKNRLRFRSVSFKLYLKSGSEVEFSVDNLDVKPQKLLDAINAKLNV